MVTKNGNNGPLYLCIRSIGYQKINCGIKFDVFQVEFVLVAASQD